VPDNWYVPSYVIVRQAALKLGLDVMSGKLPRGRVGLFTPRHLAFSPSSWSCLGLPEYLLDLPRVSLSLGPRTS
jgi:hypothetical protein